MEMLMTRNQMAISKTCLPGRVRECLRFDAVEAERMPAEWCK